MTLTLENPADLRGDGPVIACWDRGDGRQATRLFDLRTDHGQESDQAEDVFPSKILPEMEVVLPRQALSDPIEPHHPHTSNKGGWPADPLAAMRWLNVL